MANQFTLQSILEAGYVCGLNTLKEAFMNADRMLEHGPWDEIAEGSLAIFTLYKETIKEHSPDTPIETLLSLEDRQRIDRELESYMQGGDADPLADDEDFDAASYEDPDHEVH